MAHEVPIVSTSRFASLADIVRVHARERGERTAMIDGERRWSWSEQASARFGARTSIILGFVQGALVDHRMPGLGGGDLT